jgi:hypothetical protein
LFESKVFFGIEAVFLKKALIFLSGLDVGMIVSVVNIEFELGRFVFLGFFLEGFFLFEG